MLDLSASPTTLPATGQAPETADLPQTTLETPAEAGEEGFSGLLASNLQLATETQDVLGELVEFMGPDVDPELPESGMMLPHDAAAGVSPLPGALALPQAAAPLSQVPVIKSSVQAIDAEEAAFAGLPQKQPLAQAVKSLLIPKETSRNTPSPEQWSLSLSANPGLGSDPAAGPINPLPESTVVKDHLLGVAKGIETMPVLRSPSAGGDPSLTPSAAPAAAGSMNTMAAAEQASAVKMPPVNIAVGDKGWDQSIGERITWMLGNRIQKAEVRLSPPHLGPLEIRVSVQNDQASVSIAAPHVMTREAIEAAIPRLREMMQEGNLTLVNVNVEDRSPGQQNTAGESGEGGEQGSAQAQADRSTDAMAGPETEGSRVVVTGLVDDYA